VAPVPGAARQPLFPGLVALAAVAAWFLRRGWRGHPFRAELAFYAILALVAAVLALGPVLDVGVRVPLPFAGAYYAFPGASLVRAPARFFVLAVLGLAVLAGAGLGARGLRRSRVASAVVALVPVLAAVELFPGPLAVFDPLPGGLPPVYDRLTATERPVVLLELPMPADETKEGVPFARYQLYSLTHGKRLVNGIGALVPPVTQEVRRVVQRFPDDASIRMIQDLGVGFVFVHAASYPPHRVGRLREDIQEREELKWIEDSHGVWVVEVVPKQFAG
jgi:hypothetical protein